MNFGDIGKFFTHNHTLPIPISVVQSTNLDSQGALNMGVASLIVGLLPFVGSMIISIEGLFGHGNGMKKKEAVVIAVTSGLGIAGNVLGKPIDPTAAATSIASLVDEVVAMYNSLGFFSHGAAGDAPLPTSPAPVAK